MPTRLLDWSLNPLAALFFALVPANVDGLLFVMDAYQIGKRGLCTSRSHEVTEAMKAIFEWQEDCWPEVILPVRPSNLDVRVSAQRGCFTFYPPSVPKLDRKHNPSLLSYAVPAKVKTDLRKELELLGVEFSIYGDLDHLAERLKRAYRK
jgi:hypothetical protein